MDAFYAKLSKCRSKPIPLSLPVIPEYADSYFLKNRCMPTISDLFDKKYLDLCYPELLKACHEVDIKITKEQITQAEREIASHRQRVTVSSDIELEELGAPRGYISDKSRHALPVTHSVYLLS